MDIVERLRGLFSNSYGQDEIERAIDILEEAADEIERLRKALKIFADNVNETNVGIDKNWAETVYALKAENQQLREALTGLYEVCRWEKVAPEIDAAKAAIVKATGKPATEGE